MKTAIVSNIILPIKLLFRRERTVIGRERLALLLFCYIPVMLIGVAANFAGATEPSAPFFNYTHTAFLAVAAIVFCLYCKQKIDIGACLAAFTLTGQAIVSVEMLYCAFNATPYYIMLIMANTVLLAMNAMVSVAAYMKKNTIVLGTATLLTYVACALITAEALLESFIPVFAIAFFFVSAIGFWVAKASQKLEDENQKMKRDEMEVLHMLRLKRNEVKAYIELASEKNTVSGTRVLLDRLDRRSRHNILTNIEEYFKARDADMDSVARAFPEFTASEREICRLILRGKRLGEISVILEKKESNITSQRASMRRKLGLKPSDNLLEALQQRMAL